MDRCQLSLDPASALALIDACNITANGLKLSLTHATGCKALDDLAEFTSPEETRRRAAVLAAIQKDLLGQLHAMVTP